MFFLDNNQTSGKDKVVEGRPYNMSHVDTLISFQAVHVTHTANSYRGQFGHSTIPGKQTGFYIRKGL